MGLAKLQNFMEEFCPECCVRLKLGQSTKRKQTLKQKQSSQLYMVVDAEDCLHRLYGGLYNDWVCGGQWNQMINFLTFFVQAAEKSNIEMVIFFNGSLEKERLQQWGQSQNANRENIKKICNLASRKGTPPPKAWFVKPVFIEYCARLAFTQLGVKVLQSKTDHTREIIAYCRGNAFHGVMGQAADYIAFDPPRYFSSHNLKLARASPVISTVEYNLEVFAVKLGLSQQQLPLLSTLLGNHILPEADLAAFQWSLVKPVQIQGSEKKNTAAKELHALPPIEKIVPSLVKFIKSFKDQENIGLMVKEVFKFSMHNFDEKVKRFKESVKYYSSASRDGGSFKQITPEVSGIITNGVAKRIVSKSEENDVKTNTVVVNENNPSLNNVEEKSSSENNDAVSGVKDNINDVEEIIPISSENDVVLPEEINPTSKLEFKEKKNKDGENMTREMMKKEENSPSKKITLKKPLKTIKNITAPPLPDIPPDILRLATHQHDKGSMHPYIYQILAHGEIKLSLSIEETSRKVPSVKDLFQPIRKHVYSLLFSTTSKPVGPVVIKEWFLDEENDVTCELVSAATFQTWEVPSLELLWTGQEAGMKNKRMRAFLSCLNADSPVILDRSFVPQNYFVFCCILRYLIQFPTLIISHHEIDALLATAVCTSYHSSKKAFDSPLTTRGLYLASMVMRGLEMAVLANDTCGQPIPPDMFSPHLFFDGKLFQSKWNMAFQHSANLVGMCEGKIGRVAKVEKMRQAIMRDHELKIPPFDPYSYSAIPPLVEDEQSRNCEAELSVAGVPTASWSRLPERTPNYNYFKIMAEEKRQYNARQMQRGIGRGTVYKGNYPDPPYYDDDIY